MTAADAIAAAGPQPAGAGFTVFGTAIGECVLSWRQTPQGSVFTAVQLPGLTRQQAIERLRRRLPGIAPAPPPADVRAAMDRIRALLEGAPDGLLDLPLDMAGVPPFHQRVYALARAIPPGATLTYGEVARQLGEPGAARAVGQALGSNPFAPVVPCHRVLAAGARPGGFSATGGLRTKLRLLEIEGARLGPAPGPGLFDRDFPASCEEGEGREGSRLLR